MPVEEIEETKTVEETTTKEVIICDGCGVNDDTGDNRLYQFYGQSLQENLYFCEECLDLDRKAPISDRISSRLDINNEDEMYWGLSLLAIVTPVLAGYIVAAAFFDPITAIIFGPFAAIGAALTAMPLVAVITAAKFYG